VTLHVVVQFTVCCCAPYTIVADFVPADTYRTRRAALLALLTLGIAIVNTSDAGAVPGVDTAAGGATGGIADDPPPPPQPAAAIAQQQSENTPA
jgi:hypothetical protein